MRICPACKTQYSDDTLQYCLQDGTPLTGGRASDTPTVALGETETAVALGGQEGVNETERETWQQSQVTHVAAASAKGGSFKTLLIVVLGAVALFALLGLVGVGAWTFWRNSQASVASNNADRGFPTSNSNSNYGTYPSPQTSPVVGPTGARPVATPSTTSTIGTSPPAGNDEQTRGEISQRVYGWKSSLESRDFNGYMDNYASTVDYYNRRGVSSGTIRSDKARAFSLYNSMRVNVSNMSVNIDPSGNAATAVFDKEWSFSGGSRSEGKTRSQLQFRMINGSWLITAERDLKLYYKR